MVFKRKKKEQGEAIQIGADESKEEQKEEKQILEEVKEVEAMPEKAEPENKVNEWLCTSGVLLDNGLYRYTVVANYPALNVGERETEE